MANNCFSPISYRLMKMGLPPNMLSRCQDVLTRLSAMGADDIELVPLWHALGTDTPSKDDDFLTPARILAEMDNPAIELVGALEEDGRLIVIEKSDCDMVVRGHPIRHPLTGYHIENAAARIGLALRLRPEYRLRHLAQILEAGRLDGGPGLLVIQPRAMVERDGFDLARNMSLALILDQEDIDGDDHAQPAHRILSRGGIALCASDLLKERPDPTFPFPVAIFRLPSLKPEVEVRAPLIPG